MNQSRRVYKTSIGKLLLLLAATGFADSGLAHSPHDNISILAVSPDYQYDETLYVVILDQIQRSTDGGLTWKRLRNGLTNKASISSIALSPQFSADSTVFVSTRGDGIYISRDRGSSWHHMDEQPKQDDIRRLRISKGSADDYALLAIAEEGGLYLQVGTETAWREILGTSNVVNNVTLFADTNNIRVLAEMSDGQWHAWNSRLDIWEASAFLSEQQPYLIEAVETSTNVSLILAATTSFVLVSIDNGNTFEKKDIPQAESNDVPLRLTSFGMVEYGPADASLFSTAWKDGVYIIGNTSSQWQRQSDGLTRTVQADEFHQPHFKQLSARGDTVFVAGFDGLFRSDNGGKKWFQLETIPAKLPTSFDVKPGKQDLDHLAISTFDSGIHLSSNGGSSWKPMNYGLKNTHLWSVTFATADRPGSLLLATSNMSVYRLENSNSDWEQVILGCRATLASRSSVGRYWDRFKAFFSKPERCRHTFPHAITYSPFVTEKRQVFFGTRYDGIHRSDDDGKSWHRVLDTGGLWVDAIVPSPNQKENGFVFSSVRGDGIYRSDSGGRKWSLISNKEIGETLKQFPNSAIPLVVSPDFANDGTLFAGTISGLYESVDQGVSWGKIADAGSMPNDGAILAIALSPEFAADGEILVSVKGRGLQRSQNRGESFKKVAPQLLNDNQILSQIRYSANYQENKRVYAISEEEMFVSSNGGISWNVLRRPARYEDRSHTTRFSGNWTKIESDSFSGNTAMSSSKKGDRVELTFEGTRIGVVSTNSQDQGTANVYLDAQLIGQVDQYVAGYSPIRSISTFDGLAQGTHLIAVVVTGSHSMHSSGTRIVIDAFDVD